VSKDDADGAATVVITKVDSAATPDNPTGDDPMNEKQLKDLEKAAADSTSAIAKVAEVETKVGELKTGQEQIAAAVSNIAKILGKMAGIEEAEPGQRVARTNVQETVTVRKTDDTTQQGADPDDRELSRDELMKLSQGERDRRYAKQAARSFQNPKVVTNVPTAARAR
jgi:hypothetical protein